jgi:hypothetical protein
MDLSYHYCSNIKARFIFSSIDTPKKKSSLTWSEIEASAEANDIPLNQEDIDKFLERKKERIQHQLLLS